MELTARALQAVNTYQDVLFTDVPVKGGNCIIHRDDSGLVNLRGMTANNYARYKVDFSGNIAVPTGGTVDSISLSIAIDGEPLGATEMISTPGAVDDFNSVSSATFIDVPAGCCSQLSIINTSTQTIDVQNANLIVERVA